MLTSTLPGAGVERRTVGPSPVHPTSNNCNEQQTAAPAIFLTIPPFVLADLEFLAENELD
jgi:hypothetical protein